MYDLMVRFLADGLVVIIALIAVGALLLKTPAADRYDRYTYVVMAGLTSYILAKFIGSLWQPEQLRPFEQLGLNPGAAYLNNPGFPSDHALLAFFLVFAVWFATGSRKLTLTLAALAVLMCIGRVLALVHTPLDVAGSLVIAGLGALWYVGYAKKLPYKLLAKRAKK
jgi:undecaprenyl-diphosphatase